MLSDINMHNSGLINSNGNFYLQKTPHSTMPWSGSDQPTQSTKTYFNNHQFQWKLYAGKCQMGCKLFMWSDSIQFDMKNDTKLEFKSLI